MNPAEIVNIWDCRDLHKLCRKECQGDRKVETLAAPDLNNIQSAGVNVRSLPVNYFRQHRNWPGQDGTGSNLRTCVRT